MTQDTRLRVAIARQKAYGLLGDDGFDAVEWRELRAIIALLDRVLEEKEPASSVTQVAMGFQEVSHA